MQAFVKIKRISKKRGLSLYQLNNQAGLKANVIYSWKTKNPSVEKLKAVDYLLNDANEASLAADPTELSKNQRAIAKLIDPDISNDDCQAIIKILLWPSSSTDPISLIKIEPFYLCFAH